MLTTAKTQRASAQHTDALSTGYPLEVQPKCAIKSSRRLWRETSQLTTVLTHLFRCMDSSTEKRLRGVYETESGRFDCLKRR
jgi:hypothetical protein